MLNELMMKNFEREIEIKDVGPKQQMRSFFFDKFGINSCFFAKLLKEKISQLRDSKRLCGLK